MYTEFTGCPSAPDCLVTKCFPRTSPAKATASSALLTTLTPPYHPVSKMCPCPLPPAKTYDLTTHPFGCPAAIFLTSSTVKATSPIGILTLYELRRAPA